MNNNNKKMNKSNNKKMNKNKMNKRTKTNRIIINYNQRYQSKKKYQKETI